jgi:hypothetical protein
MFLKTSASFANSNVSSMAILDAFEFALSSHCNWCTKSYQRAKKERKKRRQEGVSVPYRPTRQGHAPRKYLRAEPMLSWHAVAAEWWKLA